MTQLRLATLGPAAVILAVAFVGHARQRQLIARVVLERDSAVTREAATERGHRDVLHSGEKLPVIRLRDGSGTVVRLDSLPGRGVRYLYFYRDDCKACRLLQPSLANGLERMKGSIAQVAVDYHREQTPHNEVNSFALIPDSGIRHIVATVPSLIVVDARGRVVATADFSSYRVVQLLDMYGIIRLAEADQALRRDSSAKALPVAPAAAPLPIKARW